MARRRKSTRRRSSRRRMGAVGKANITAALGIIAGAVIGKKVAGFIPVGDSLSDAWLLAPGIAPQALALDHISFDLIAGETAPEPLFPKWET